MSGAPTPKPDPGAPPPTRYAAMEGLHFWMKADRKVTQKILSLLEEIAQTPCSGRSRPEPLSHTLSSYWSRRINTKDRIIYRVDEDVATIHVIALKGHYAKL